MHGDMNGNVHVNGVLDWGEPRRTDANANGMHTSRDTTPADHAVSAAFSDDDEINDAIRAARDQGRLEAEREYRESEREDADNCSVMPPATANRRCRLLPRIIFHPCISCVKSWPRTSALVFGVICPLFLLIFVSVFFGYFLAQLEGQGVLLFLPSLRCNCSACDTLLTNAAGLWLSTTRFLCRPSN